MAGFQYRMQNILNIKYKLETQAKTAFAVAAEKVREEEEKLNSLKRKREGYEEEAKVLVSTTLDIPKINFCHQSIEIMKDRIKNQTVALHIAERNLEAARVKLNQIMIERKTHEKLKEKEFEEFKRELQDQENKAIDELVSYSYRGKRE